MCRIPLQQVPGMEKLRLLNDGFRQQQPLLITHLYLRAGFIADTLKGAVAKLQSHRESFQKAQF